MGVIRWTPPSRRNNRGRGRKRGGNVRPSVGTSIHPSVRPYVRAQKVCLISMKFGLYIEVDE